MQAHFSLEKMLNILNDRGYGYSNEKGLLQSCKEGKILLKICADLMKEYEPSYIRSILATSAYRMGEHMENHKNSLPVVSDLIIIRQIFKLTKMEFRLMDFVKPTNDRIISVLAHIYSILGWQKKINNQNEHELAKLKILKNDFAKVKDELANVERDLVDVEFTKARERPRFLELSSQMVSLKAQYNQLKTFKNDKITVKYQKEKTKSDLKKQSEQISYKNEVIDLQINQTKMKVSQNAPQIKKQKLRQETNLFQSVKQQQHTYNYYNAIVSTLKDKFQHLQRQIKRELLKSRQFKEHQTTHHELNNEIEESERYFKLQRQKLDIVKQNLERDQELFDVEQQRQNILSGKIAEKTQIQESLRLKQAQQTRAILSEQKDIEFFQNGLKVTTQDLNAKTKKLQQIISRAETKLLEIEVQTNKWNEEMFLAIKRVNEYYNPQEK